MDGSGRGASSTRRKARASSSTAASSSRSRATTISDSPIIPDVIAAAREGAARWGVGAGASHLVCGHFAAARGARSRARGVRAPLRRRGSADFFVRLPRESRDPDRARRARRRDLRRPAESCVPERRRAAFARRIRPLSAWRRRGARAAARGVDGAAQADRDRRGVQHGRRHRAAAGAAGARRRLSTRGSSSTTRTASACWGRRRIGGAARSRISASRPSGSSTWARSARRPAWPARSSPRIRPSSTRSSRPRGRTCSRRPPRRSSPKRCARAFAIIRDDATRHAHLGRLIARLRDADARCRGGSWTRRPPIQPLIVGDNTAAVELAAALVAARLLGAGDPPADGAEGNGAAARHAERGALGWPTSMRSSTRSPSWPRDDRREPSATHLASMSGTLHVESVGSGPPLVLLHGWAMHSGIWGPLVARLAQRFRVHAVDLPGHGHSAARRAVHAGRRCRGGLRARFRSRRVRSPSRLVARRARRDALGAAGAGARRAVSRSSRRRRASSPAIDWPHAMSARDPCPVRRRAARRVEAHDPALPRAADARQRARPRDARGVAPAGFRARRTVAEGALRRARLRSCTPTCAPRLPASRSRRSSLSGGRDTLALPAAGRWLADHLPDARFALDRPAPRTCRSSRTPRRSPMRSTAFLDGR